MHWQPRSNDRREFLTLDAPCACFSPLLRPLANSVDPTIYGMEKRDKTRNPPSLSARSLLVDTSLLLSRPPLRGVLAGCEPMARVCAKREFITPYENTSSSFHM